MPDFSQPAVQQQWYHLLNQRETWCHGDGTTISLLEMSTVECHHARVWLHGHAEVLMGIVVGHILAVGPTLIAERGRHDPALEWYMSIAATPGLPGSVLRGAPDWIDTSPLADTLGYLRLGGHNPQPAQHTATVEGVEVELYVMMIERGRWTFDGSKAREGYETAEDALVEARLQLTGALVGPLAELQGCTVSDQVRADNWRTSIDPLLDKGWPGLPPREFVRMREVNRTVIGAISRGLIDEEAPQ